MTNECRMTPEQWQALLGVIDTVGNDWAVDARAKARRLLVAEPEQAPQRIDCTQCQTVDVSGNACGSIACPFQGTTKPADPDLTTFGELDGPAWFELTGYGWDEGDRIRLLTDDGVVYDDEGFERCVENAEPVRRIPKPEWSK